MTEEYAENLYGPDPEGDAPQGEELVTDPGDSPSYAGLTTAPASKGREELGTLLHTALHNAMPTDPTDAEFEEAVATAASILWGAGYRRILQ